MVLHLFDTLTKPTRKEDSMKTEDFGFTIETAYGQPLATPLTVSTKYDKFESYDEIPEKELPDKKEILNFVNARNKASARAKATTEAFQEAKIEKPTLENDAKLRFNTMLKILKASGVAEETARQQAADLTGYSE